jgi:hypothetical protein
MFDFLLFLVNNEIRKMSMTKHKMSKGFQPGNQLWKLGVDSKIERKEALNGFLEKVGISGVNKYEELLEKIGNSKSLSPEEKLFMQKIENLFEYIIPKLSRQELTGKDGGALNVQIIKYDNPKK